MANHGSRIHHQIAQSPDVTRYNNNSTYVDSWPGSAIPFAPSETSTTEDPIGVYPDEEGSFNSTWPEYAYGEETEFTLSDYIYGLIPENTTATDAGIVVTEAITTNTAMSTNITTTVNPKMVRKRRKKTTTATTTVSTPRSGVAMIRVKRKRTTVAPIVVA
uniref:Uncharacterized protein n=1 Tax=Anopheles atroparvus TaxID=41427 RepID=A0A182JCX7_ANOAO